jgi:hypothetical protein
VIAELWHAQEPQKVSAMPTHNQINSTKPKEGERNTICVLLHRSSG